MLNALNKGAELRHHETYPSQGVYLIVVYPIREAQ
jgi:hypothetical protein